MRSVWQLLAIVGICFIGTWTVWIRPSMPSLPLYSAVTGDPVYDTYLQWSSNYTAGYSANHELVYKNSNLRVEYTYKFAWIGYIFLAVGLSAGLRYITGTWLIGHTVVFVIVGVIVTYYLFQGYYYYKTHQSSIPLNAEDIYVPEFESVNVKLRTPLLNNYLSSNKWLLVPTDELPHAVIYKYKPYGLAKYGEQLYGLLYRPPFWHILLTGVFKLLLINFLYILGCAGVMWLHIEYFKYKIQHAN